MEMVLSSGFCEMNQNEMLVVDGGNVSTEPCKLVVSAVVGSTVCYGITKAGEKIGKIVGSVVAGPVGFVCGAVVGAAIGNFVADLIIE